ncbi:MAG: hypothetical protein HY392_01280 [Candidatus Diapherotrites archaeon]|nr:hypothetical protein [Candidatus Diapherotrites archaeon]
MTWVLLQAQAGENAQDLLVGNWQFLIVGLVLLAAGILVFMFLKKAIVNSILGIIVWGIAVYGFNTQLAFWPSLLISALFGPAGIGAILILRFFNIQI